MTNLPNSRKEIKVTLNEIKGTKFEYTRYDRKSTSEVVRKLADGVQVWISYGVIGDSFFIAEPTVGALLAYEGSVVYEDTIEEALAIYGNGVSKFCTRTVFERLA